MKKLLAAIIILLLFTACNRSVCPAYMDGGATGTSGAKGKKQELFPSTMKKK
ncbi:MAG TPA: hypothetical protein PLD84_01590 [Chitinophagales bacterium]|nr:hypothetical protein [Chitinophagales bacterium]